MERRNCSKCNQFVEGGLDGLRRHINTVHGLTMNRGSKSTEFICGQNGCPRDFKYFYNLRKHIRMHHPAHDQDQQLHEHRPQQPNNPNHDVPIGIDNEIHNELVDEIMDLAEEREGNAGGHANEQDHTLDDYIVRMIAEFHTNPSLTCELITTILNECEGFMFSVLDLLKTKFNDFLDHRQWLDANQKEELLDNFEFENPFEGRRTLEQQVEALRENFNFIESEGVPLGYREDLVLDRETCTYEPKMVLEKFQYVNVIDVLTMVLSNDVVREAILNERPSANGILGSFIDGDFFRNHPLFQQYPHAIRLKLYYDEFEIVNPIGSKTGIHKIGACYYIIDNLPDHMKSELSNIHVLFLCYDVDVKKYSFDQIFGRFIVDLEKLESPEGVTIQINGDDFILRATISSFCADTLAAHAVCNLMGPSATHFCRRCMYSRDDLHAKRLEIGQMRTDELHRDHLQRLVESRFSQAVITATGLRGDCPLNRSRFFRSNKNFTFDLLHDVLQGFGPMALKLVLEKHILILGLYDVETLNARVRSFNYGYVEMRNKPSANFTDNMLRARTHSLNQKGMQMWLLLRVFPFLISDLVEEDDEYLNFILNLLRIMGFLFAPKIKRSVLSYLKHLIRDWIQMFIRLFPDVNLINKLHHLLHYIDSLLESGPLINDWCMRFEAKHNESKRHALNVHNFKNAPKTLLRTLQCIQCVKWGKGDVELNRFTERKGENKLIINTKSRRGLLNLGYHDMDQIFCCRSIHVNGTKYRKGLYVCLQAMGPVEFLPTFGRILEVTFVNNQVYLEVCECITQYFDPSVNAICIENGEENNDRSRRLIQVFDLAHFKPLCCWRKPNSDALYISLRYMIV
ncbi:hypothetical protein QAD02_010135 [Eretmocerus hayati]|uniref:Uncharacterized protein n=1 Tax=Eretmocerus hayati TaxID=131215 RepID=A0ACC2NDU7_9HYME|nr:hypothetical protein QAD02_010135 [Eretmocerus hayati]